MATAFNLTAQLNLRGPNNVNKIVADIKKQLSGITANVNLKLDPNVTKNVKALDSSLKSLNATLSRTSSNAGSAASAIAAFGKAVNSVSIKNIPSQINATVSSMNKLNKSSSTVSQSLTESATEMQEFGKQAGLAIRRFAAFSAVTGVIYSLSNSISQGVQAFIEYDKELVRLQQVTGQTAGGLKSLQDSISQLATGLGVSSKELTTVSVTLAQAGLSAKDTERALRALALSSLAPSFDNMNETVEGSIALMRQFGISAGQLEQALGSVNAVAAAFAVEADDLITAIQRTGGVFATASKGVSEGTDALNEFIAVFTSVRATTRESAETIATGLRTIFTRIQRGSTIDALKEFGVTLTDSEGKFVGAYRAVQLLSEGLSKLDTRDIKFSRIVEELGGFRQIGKVIPLIQQFSVAQNALKIAQTGQSSLAKDASTAQLSLANQIQKVREEFFALFREIGQSKGFQSLLTGVLTLTRGLIKLADVTKSLLPALSVVLAFKGASALTQFASGFSKGFRPGGGKPEKERPRFADGGRVRKFATGGVVPGVGNRDSVPAMLTPGEFVMNKKAVQKYGSGNLVRMNKYASGGIVNDIGGAPGGTIVVNSGKQSVGFEKDTYSINAKPEKLKVTYNKKANSYTANGKVINKKQVNRLFTNNFDSTIAWEQIVADAYDGQIANNNDPSFPIDVSKGDNLLIDAKFRKEDSYKDKDALGKALSFRLWQENKAYKYSGATKQRLKLDSLLGQKLKTTKDDIVDSGSMLMVYPEIENIPTNLTNISKGLAKRKNEAINASGKRQDIAQQAITAYGNKNISGDKGTFDLLSQYDYSRPKQKKSYGGLIQKFLKGGTVEETAQLENMSLQDAILAQIKEMGGIKGVKSLLGVPGGQRTLDSLLRAEVIKKRDTLDPTALKAVNDALSNEEGRSIRKAQAINKSQKLAVVGLQPFDKSAEIPFDIPGFESSTIFIRGLSSKYADAVSGMRQMVESTIEKFGTDIQNTMVFGGNAPLALDFDETLVSGADIFGPNGKPDIPAYDDLDKVAQALKQSQVELTPLGKKIKEIVGFDPSFINRIRVLTARPQSNAGLLSQKLNELGIPLGADKITGVSGGNKGTAMGMAERLIDDNIKNINDAKRAGKSAVQYAELRKLSEEEKAATGNANAEGAILEAALAKMGAVGGSVQNRAIDFANGLGMTAAQAFPGISPDWPTEVKRTLSSDNIGRAKEEFTRYYSENYGPWPQQENAFDFDKAGKPVSRFAMGGKASRKVDYEANVGVSRVSPFESSVSKRLSQSVYSLQKGTGLSDSEFNEIKKTADTYGYNEKEFKEYLAKRIQEKKNKEGLRTNPSALAQQLMPQNRVSTPKQLALAETLKGEPDAGYRPIPTAAERIASDRMAVQNATRRFANGGSVPALLTPGEAVIPPRMAKKIGYGKLSRMNKADRNGMGRYASGGGVGIVPGSGNTDSFGPVPLPVGSFVIRKKATEALGFNKGGAVPVQRFAAGGGVTSMIMEWLSSDMTAGTKPKMAPRPDVVNRASVVASNDTTKALDILVKSLNQLGLSAANSADILNKGGQVSYKTIQKALAEDIKRLKISGASIQSIVAAETTLANIRKKSKEEVNKQKNIQGLTSLRGNSSTKIIGGQTIGDLQAGSGAGQQAIETQAQMLAAARIKRRGGKVTEKQRSDIMQSSYVDAASRVTGIKKKEFKSAGISGEDIQKYISDSMKDRKSLSQMDKQLVALRLEEYNLHKTVNGVAVKSAQEAEKLAKEEISTRRKIINDLAAQNGTRGVGAAGLRDTRNSPILNQIKGFIKSPGRVMGGVSVAAGLAAGSSDMIAKNMYDMSTTEGQGKAAKTSAAIQSSGTILSTGLAAASQMAAIPVIGPYVAALTAVGTAAAAAADYFYDFTGSQKAATIEFERAVRAKEIGIAMDGLDRAFQNFEKDMGNINLQKALEKSLGTVSSIQIKDNMAERDNARAEFALKNRSWSDIFSGNFKGSTNMDALQQGAMDTEMSQKMASIADKSMALYEQQINSGKSIQDIVNNVRTGSKEAGAAGFAVAASVNPKLWSELENAVKLSGDASEQNREKIQKEIAARELLTNAQLQSIERMSQLNKGMEAADRAGRRLAETFEHISETIDQSIQRMQRESQIRQAQAADRVEARRGNAGFDERAVNNRNVGVLTSPKAYQNDPGRIEEAIRAGTTGMSPELAQKMAGGARLEATLPNVMRNAVSSELKTNASLSLEDAVKAARTRGTEAIRSSGLSEADQKVAIDKLNAKLKTEEEKAQKEGGKTNKEKVDFFTDSISELGPEIASIFGNAGKRLDDIIQARQGIYDTFAKNLQAASEAAKKAREFFSKARDIRYNAGMDLREAQTGVGESYSEAKAKSDSSIARLTGGTTDPQAIGRNIDALTARRDQQMKARDAAASDPNLTAKQQEDAAIKFAKDIQATNNALNDNREALDKMANSAELAQKALDEVKNVRGLQQDRENFVNQLLTNTPEEADKLNQSFIRLQRNLSGGLNNASNQRDARNAFNDTLRRTGNLREATRAGNTVLADQRKQTLQLMQDPGFRGMMTLNMKNQALAQNKNLSDVDIDNAFKQQEARLMNQMAVESGLINNPMVRQALAVKQNPNAEPAMKKAAEQFLQSTGLQAKATEEQGRLELANVQSLLVTATDDLRTSIDALTTSINASLGKDGERVPGVVGPMVPVPAGARGARPVGRMATGGKVKTQYASTGQLIDFSPKGTDTVPAMLTPGEFVVNARSTAQHLPLLKAINSGAGVDATSNMSKGGVVYLDNGGLIDEFRKIDANRSNLLEVGEIDLKMIQSLDRDKDNKVSFGEYSARAKSGGSSGSSRSGSGSSVKSGFKAQDMSFEQYYNQRAKKYSDRYQGTGDEFPRESEKPKNFANGGVVSPYYLAEGTKEPARRVSAVQMPPKKDPIETARAARKQGVPTKRRPSLVPGDPRAKDAEPSFFRLDLNEDGILDRKEGYPYQDLDKDKDGNITQEEWKNNVLARAEVRKLENEIKIDQQTIDNGGPVPADFGKKQRQLIWAKRDAGMAAADGDNQAFIARQKRIDDNVNKRLLGGGSINNPDGSYVFNRELNKIYDRRSAFEEERRAQRAKDENATDEEIFDRTVEAYGAGDSNYWRNSMGVTELPNVYDNSRTLDVIRNESDLSTRGDPNGEKTRAYIDGYVASQGARQQSDRVARGIGAKLDSPDIAVTGTQGPVDNLNYLIDQKEKGRVAEKAARDENFKQDEKNREDARTRQTEKQANLEKRAKELGVTVDTSDIRGTIYESGGGFSNQPGSGRAVSVEEQKQRRVEKAINSKLSFTDKTGRYSTTGTIDKVDLEKGTVRIAKMDGKTGQPKVDENGDQVYTTVPLDKLSNKSRDKVIADAEARGEAVIKAEEEKSRKEKLAQEAISQDIASIDVTSSLPDPPVVMPEDFTDQGNQMRQEAMANAAMEQTKIDALPVMPETKAGSMVDPISGKMVVDSILDEPKAAADKNARAAQRKSSEDRYQELRGRSQAESKYDRSWLGENWPKEWGGAQKPEKRLTRKELEELGAMESERGVPFASRLGANVSADQTRRNAGLDEAQIESLSQQKTEQFKAELEKKNDAEGGVAVGLAAQRALVPLVAGGAAVLAAPALVPAGVIGAGLTIAGGVGVSLTANKLQDIALEGTDFDKRQKELAEKRPGATAVGSLLPGLLTGNPLTGATTMGRALATRAASGATEAALGAGIRGATSGGDFGTLQDAGMDFISGAILPSPNFGNKGSKNYSRPEGGTTKPKTNKASTDVFNDVKYDFDEIDLTNLRKLNKTVKAEQRAITEENVLGGAEILATKRKQEEARRAAQEKQRVRDEAEAVKEAGREEAVFDFFSPLITKPNNPNNTSEIMRGGSSLLNKLDTEFKSSAILKQANSLSTEQLTKQLTDSGIDPAKAAELVKKKNNEIKANRAMESAKSNAQMKEVLDADFKRQIDSTKDPKEIQKIKDAYKERMRDFSKDKLEADRAGTSIQSLRQQRANKAEAKNKAESDKLIQEFDSTLGSSKPTTIDNPPIGKPLDLGIDPLAPIVSAKDNAATTAASTKPVDAATVAAKNQTVVKAAEQENTSSLQTSAIPQPKPYNPTDYPIMDSIMRGGKNGHYGPMGTTNITGKQNIYGISGWKTRLIPKDDASAAKIKEFLDTHPDIGEYKLALNEGPVPVFSVYFKKGTKDEALSFAQASEKGLKDSLDPRLYQGADTLLEGTNISARFDARDLKYKSASSIIDRQLENSPFSRGFLKAEELNLQILPSNTASGSTASRAMPNITAGTRGVPDTGYVDWLKTKKFLAKDPKKIASLDAEIQRATNVADDWLKENMSDIYSSSAERTARESTGPQQQAVVETATRDATSSPTKSPIAREEFELGELSPETIASMAEEARIESQARTGETKPSVFEQNPENFTTDLAETLSPFPEGFFPDGSSKPNVRAEAEINSDTVNASSPETLKASAEAKKRLAAQKLAAKSPEQISVEKTYGPLYREAKKANDTAEMARIKSVAKEELKKRSQEASTKTEDKKNGFLPVMGKALAIAAPIGSAIGYGLGSLLTGAMNKKKEPEDLSSRLENASSLQEVFDLLKLAEKDKTGNPTNPLTQVGGSSPLIAKLQKLAPEIYGKKGSDYFSAQDLAAMQEDAYNENFLYRLKDNAASAQATAKPVNYPDVPSLDKDKNVKPSFGAYIPSLDSTMAPQQYGAGVYQGPSAMPTFDLTKTKTDAAAMPEVDAKDNNAAPMPEVKKPVKKALGGIVYASNGALINAQPMGTDTVPAMLTPGEFVVKREQAQKHAPILHAINSGAYSRGGIVNYLANGGIVNPNYLSYGGYAKMGEQNRRDPLKEMSQRVAEYNAAAAPQPVPLPAPAPVQVPSPAPVGGVSNNIGIDLAGLQSIVADFQKTVNDFGASVPSLSQVAESMNTGFSSFVTGGSQIGEMLNSATAGLQQVNLPDRIRLEGSVSNNVNINGAEAAARVMDTMGGAIQQGANEQIGRFAGAINRGIGSLGESTLGPDTGQIMGQIGGKVYG